MTPRRSAPPRAPARLSSWTMRSFSPLVISRLSMTTWDLRREGRRSPMSSRSLYEGEQPATFPGVARADAAREQAGAPGGEDGRRLAVAAHAPAGGRGEVRGQAPRP